MRSLAPTLMALLAFGCDGGEANDDLGDDGSVAGSPAIVMFDAAQAAVDRFQSVELRWKVENARTVTIFSATEILISTDQQEGSVMTLPLRSKSSFTLRVAGSGPALGRTLDVEVIWPEPVIESFRVEPAGDVIIGGIRTLYWTTVNAQTVTILENGNPAANGTFMGSQANQGVFTAFVNTASTTYTLRAANPTHTREQDIQTRATEPPQVLEFSASPRTFIGSSTVVTLTWDTIGFDALELQVQFNIDRRFPGTSAGTYQVEIYGQTDFYLVGYVDGFIYSQYYAVSGPPQYEFEPNNDPTGSNYLYQGSGVQGTIDLVGDIDYYTLDLLTPTDLHLWIRGETPGSCPTDTTIELVNLFDGTTVAMDQDSGFPTGRGGNCAEIDSEVVEAVRGLTGTFYIIVSGQRNETGSYILMTNVAGGQGGRG